MVSNRGWGGQFSKSFIHLLYPSLDLKLLFIITGATAGKVCSRDLLTLAFSRASRRLHVLASRFDWFTGLPVSFVNDLFDYFGAYLRHFIENHSKCEKQKPSCHLEV